MKMSLVQSRTSVVQTARSWVSLLMSLGVILSGMMGTGCGAEDEPQPVNYCDVQPIIHEKCLRCHGDPPVHPAPPQLILDTYARVYVVRFGVEREVRARFMPIRLPSAMPPVEDLTEGERDLLLQWLEEGAAPCE